MEGRVFENFPKFFFSKFQKCPKSFPKVSKRVLNVFWGKFSENFFCPVFRGGSSFQKFSKKNIFKIPKMPKSVPKSIQTCYRVIFSKKFYAQCSMEGRVFENFPIFFSKFQKCPKSFPKVSKRVLNLFWGKLFEIFFLPSVPWRVEFSKIFTKNIFKIPKMPKSVLKSIQTCFEHVLGKNF